jgi:signal transduction histidine kinase
VLYRKVWRDGQRLIQGALLEAEPFLRGTLEAAFQEDASSQTSDLVVAYRGNLLATFAGQASRDYLSRAEELQGSLLYQTRLSAPLSHLELIFSVRRLLPGPGGLLLGWVATSLAVVLCGGCYLFYRLGLRQIDLVRQQQDFVSAVSHELKTPLTSIRLFSELLCQGWATEEKKRSYYDYIYQ